jgi:cadmium resistance protein CadD (predicted permease)
MKADSPFAPYALQILGLTFILPIVLLAALALKVESQAVVGLLGTIIGYIFGTSKSHERKRKRNQGERQDEKTR